MIYGTANSEYVTTRKLLQK